MRQFQHIIIFALLLVACCGNAEASSPRYIALADSADTYIRNEKWTEAERIIIEALRLEPANFSNSLLFSNLGVVRTRRGDYKSALEAFELGLAIAPSSTVIMNNRAQTYMLQADYANARSDLDNSLAIDSVQEWPLLMRGQLRLGENDLKGAAGDFSFLLKHFPDNFSAMEGLGRVADMEGNYDNAIKYFDEALKMHDNTETRSLRILTKIKNEKYSEAAIDLSESLSHYPDYADFYVWRGYLHRLNYRNEEAQADKKNAIVKGADPQFVEQFIP